MALSFLFEIILNVVDGLVADFRFTFLAIKFRAKLHFLELSYLHSF